MNSPKLGSQAFTCSHCRVLSQQTWNSVLTSPLYHSSEIVRGAKSSAGDSDVGVAGDATLRVGVVAMGQHAVAEALQMSVCANCRGMCLWLRGKMIFPVKSLAPEASSDLPDVAISDYEEAARVFPHSPRASAALLRLTTEKLLGHILGKASSIDAMIADFVKLGVNPTITKAMDVLRVTGNEAVHPGTMSSVGDRATAISLFGLVNIIVEAQITQPKHVQNLFDGLPESKRVGIEQRNKRVIGE